MSRASFSSSLMYRRWFVSSALNGCAANDVCDNGQFERQFRPPFLNLWLFCAHSGAAAITIRHVIKNVLTSFICLLRFIRLLPIRVCLPQCGFAAKAVPFTDLKASCDSSTVLEKQIAGKAVHRLQLLQR